jgi:hypothetical protein
LATKEQVLAQVILGYIEEHPERHDQSQWTDIDEKYKQPEQVEACGTTGCVAGYSVLFSNDPRFKYETNESRAGTYVTIQPRLEKFPEYTGYNGSWFEAGKENLGLSDVDASKLFYHTTNEEARKALAYLARGEKINWVEVKRDEEEE